MGGPDSQYPVENSTHTQHSAEDIERGIGTCLVSWRLRHFVIFFNDMHSDLSIKSFTIQKVGESTLQTLEHNYIK